MTSAAPIAVLPVEVADVTHLIDRSRHGATDVLRFAAVVVIAFLHAGVLPALPALLGMHALIAAAVVFAARPSKAMPIDIVARRASRLLVPWGVFAVLHLAFAVRDHNVHAWMFLIGGSVHLWFVPFIFLVTCGVALACRNQAWPTGVGRAIVFGVVSLALIHAEARWTPAMRDAVPLWQFFDGATAVAVILAVLSTPGGARPRVMTAAALAALSVPLWLPWRTADMMFVSPAALGTLIFLLVSCLPAGANRLTDFLGRASFGLYLMHMVVLSPVVKIAARWRHETPAELSPMAVSACVVLAIVLSLTFIAVLERTPARRAVI